MHGPTPRDIRENLEVRAELEGLGAELAAQRIDDAQLGRLRDALQQFETVGDLGSESSRVDEAADLWRRANEQFHTTLIEAAEILAPRCEHPGTPSPNPPQLNVRRLAREHQTDQIQCCRACRNSRGGRGTGCQEVSAVDEEPRVANIGNGRSSLRT